MTRKIESFKYKGTPEQMVKVSDWLLSNGFTWWDGDRNGEYLSVSDDTNDFCYAIGYELDPYSVMPPELELEIFGTTGGITGKPENPWQMNTGKMPVDGDTLIDVLYRDHLTHEAAKAEVFWWDLRDCGSDIIKWRYAEKSDEEYFKYPDTQYERELETLKEVAKNRKLTMDEAMDLVINWPKKQKNERIVSFDEAVQIVEDSIPVEISISAVHILNDAAITIGTRAVERDKGESERSMESCVNAFNALTKHTLTEEQGWLFMVVLKMARSQGGQFKLDDYLDGAAYFALAGEAAAKEVK